MVAGVDVAFPGALGPEAVLVHREHYIGIRVVSNCAGDVGRWPDALIPDVSGASPPSQSAPPPASGHNNLVTLTMHT